jgi:WD40 repeat protein
MLAFLTIGASTCNHNSLANGLGGASQHRQSDLHVDSLPPGALARLGTIRFRQPRVRALVVSPDGKLLATTSDVDRFARLWNVAGGEIVRRMKLAGIAGEDHPSAVLFSSDSRTLYVGGSRSLAQFDVATGQEMWRLSVPQVVLLVLAPNGSSLAVGCHGQVILVDVKTSRVIRRLDTGLELRALCFVGKSLAVSAHRLSPRQEDGITFWDLTTGKKVRHLAPSVAFSSLALSRDGSTLTAVEKPFQGRPVGNAIRRWEANTGKELSPITCDVAATDIAFGHGDKWLVVSSSKRLIHIWDIDEEKELYRIRAGWPFAVFNDGRLLAYSFGGGIAFWDILKKREFGPGGHHGAISALAWAPNGKTLATGGRDNTVRVWNPQTGIEVRRWGFPDVPAFSGIRSLAYAPDGRELAGIGEDGRVRLWDMRRGKEASPLVMAPKQSSPEQNWEITYSSDGRYLLASGRRTIRVWDTTTKKELAQLEPEGLKKGLAIATVAISRDNTLAAGLVSDRSFAILVEEFLAQSRRRLWLHTFPEGNFGPFGSRRPAFYQMSFSVDHRMLAAVGQFYRQSLERPYSVEMREMASGEIRCRIGGASYHALAFAPDQRTLLLAPFGADRDPEKAVIFWDLEEIGSLKGHLQTVNKLAISPDGRFLATGSEDTTVLIWDLGKVLPRRSPTKLSARDLNKLFHDLAKDASQAYRATRILERAGDATANFLSDIFGRVITGAESKRIAALVEALGSSEFPVRQKAHQELQELGEFAQPALEQALEKKPSLEFRRRAEQLFVNMGSNRQRLSRAIEVLEIIGTTKARQVLTVAAEGPPGATITREAREALRRLGGKNSNVRGADKGLR